MKRGLAETLERIAALIEERRNASGETSYVARLLAGHEDAVLLTVEQAGGIACHTGRASCFFRKLEDGRWVTTDPVLKDPALIYRK